MNRKLVGCELSQKNYLFTFTLSFYVTHLLIFSHSLYQGYFTPILGRNLLLNENCGRDHLNLII